MKAYRSKDISGSWDRFVCIAVQGLSRLRVGDFSQPI